MKNSLNVDQYDQRDPNPWLALFLDDSIPINKISKEALMRDNNSFSRRYFFPLIFIWSKLSMFFIHIFKYFIPNLLNSSKMLHKILAWGLKHFVSPDANLLIFRHFHVGTEILQFISGNVPEVEIEGHPLKPYDFDDVKDDLFLQHDLNLYNFVIQLNQQLREKNLEIEPQEHVNLSMITEGQFDHIQFPNRWTNVLDLRSAIELFTPVYQFFLTSNDFLRAANSLQLDETIAIYSTTILNLPGHLGLVNNKHPMVPVSTYGASYRLVLHGLAAETLHEILVKMKVKRQNKTEMAS